MAVTIQSSMEKLNGSSLFYTAEAITEKTQSGPLAHYNVSGILNDDKPFFCLNYSTAAQDLYAVQS